MPNKLEDRIRFAKMKSRHKGKLKPWYKKWWGVVILILGAVTISFVTMSAIYVYQSVTRINADREALYSGKRPDLIKLLVEGVGRPYVGNPDAEIVIVEFSDFSCPYCQENQAAIRSIMAKYGDKVKLIYRNLILHEDSEYLSLASLCAGEQKDKNGENLFWPMHHKLYDLQGKIKYDDLVSIAAEIGADKKTFYECLVSEKFIPNLKSDMDSAKTLQITGSPSWFINNFKIDGLVSEEEFENMIQELIRSGTALEPLEMNATSTDDLK